MWREFGGDVPLNITVTRVETSEEIQHLAQLEDGVTDVVELIGEAVELGVVVVDR